MRAAGAAIGKSFLQRAESCKTKGLFFQVPYEISIWKKGWQKGVDVGVSLLFNLSLMALDMPHRFDEQNWKCEKLPSCFPSIPGLIFWIFKYSKFGSLAKLSTMYIVHHKINGLGHTFKGENQENPEFKTKLLKTKI